MNDQFDARQMRAGCDPLLVGLERQSQPVVGDAHIAVRVARHRSRRHGLHLLRHHPDISGVAAVVDEAIVAEAVVEPPKQHDVVLKAHIGATSSAATAHSAAPAATESASSAASEASAAETSPAAHSGAAEASRPASAE